MSDTSLPGILTSKQILTEFTIVSFDDIHGLSFRLQIVEFWKNTWIRFNPNEKRYNRIPNLHTFLDATSFPSQLLWNLIRFNFHFQHL
jgi:hypothetical protein